MEREIDSSVVLLLNVPNFSLMRMNHFYWEGKRYYPKSRHFCPPTSYVAGHFLWLYSQGREDKVTLTMIATIAIPRGSLTTEHSMGKVPSAILIVKANRNY